MKPTILFTLSFLLFSFTAYFPLTIAEQVLDIGGNPIFPGGKFYIMPSIFGPTGGGVRLGKTGNSKCPVTVLQDFSWVVKGIPVQFELPEISTGIINTGTPLNIVFVEKPDCVESSKWVVVRHFVPKGLSSIGIGGLEDHPQGIEITEGNFNIQKHGFGYKLVFCPLATAPPGSCYDIGRFPDQNGRRLILADGDPYGVVFENADIYNNPI